MINYIWINLKILPVFRKLLDLAGIENLRHFFDWKNIPVDAFARLLLKQADPKGFLWVKRGCNELTSLSRNYSFCYIRFEFSYSFSFFVFSIFTC